jgi:hypothetical protein
MTDFKLNRIHQKELQESLQVSGEANPRTRALGEQWRQQFQAHRDIVQQGLDYFKNNPFYYTKLPDVMINNPSDQFLFDKRRGFCEHFASSFVLLMRYAGVPSRVVTGYQGIEENEVGNYYIVRQSNAHAWAEVWLADSGWTRIDPTAMIPPERIEADILDTSIERLDFSSLNLPDLNQLAQSQKTALYHFWKQLNQSLDNIKYTWNNWILGYDQSKQNLFLTLMGLNPDWKTLIMLLVASIMIILISLQLINFYNNYKQIDIIFRHYQKFLNKLNRSGLTISPSDGPEFIKQLTIKNYPQQRNQIISIIDTYLLIRYGNQSSAHLVQQFKQQIRQLKLSLSSRNTVKQ